MARKVVTDAVDARLAAEWTHTDVVPLNETYEPPIDGDGNPNPFLVVLYPVSVTDHRPLGKAGPSTESGSVLFRLHTHRGVGTVEARQWRDELAALFHLYDVGTVHFGPADPGDDSDESDDGNYFVSRVTVTYQYNFSNPE